MWRCTAILRDQISSGQITDKLPSESYLRQQHGITRGTVRRAIEILTDEGLVYRHGVCPAPRRLGAGPEGWQEGGWLGGVVVIAGWCCGRW
jgi:DNA-binding transcriptional MocR family regulator